MRRQRTTSTLHGACCTTLELTEPSSHRCAALTAGAHDDHVGALLLGLVDVMAAASPLRSTIVDHVVNGVGGPADTSRIGSPVYIVDYPS